MRPVGVIAIKHRHVLVVGRAVTRWVKLVAQFSAFAAACGGHLIAGSQAIRTSWNVLWRTWLRCDGTWHRFRVPARYQYPVQVHMYYM